MTPLHLQYLIALFSLAAAILWGASTLVSLQPWREARGGVLELALNDRNPKQWYYALKIDPSSMQGRQANRLLVPGRQKLKLPRDLRRLVRRGLSLRLRDLVLEEHLAKALHVTVKYPIRIDVVLRAKIEQLAA